MSEFSRATCPTAAQPHDVDAPLARPLTPAELAATLLLERTLEQHPDLPDDFLLKGAAVLVQVPQSEWLHAIADAWRRRFHTDGNGTPLADEDVPWIELRGGTRWHRVASDDGMATPRADGCAIVGFSHAPRDCLPPDLLVIADHWLVVPLIAPSLVAVLAEQVTGSRPSASLDADACRCLGITDLSLASRPGQTADAYVAEVGRIAGTRRLGMKEYGGGATVAGDPGMVAAEVLVARTMAATPRLSEAVRAGGMAVVVEVPSAAWVDPVATAWSRHTVGGAVCFDGDEPPRRWDLFTSRSAWAIFRRPGDGDGRRSECYGVVAHALAGGAGVVGFSPAPRRFLPADLLRAADLSLSLSLAPLDPEAVAEIVETVTGRLPSILPDAAACRLLSVEEFRLARRPGQSADDYVIRLQRLAPQRAARPVTLDDLHGMGAAVAWGRTLAADLRLYRDGHLSWQNVDRGALLYGPPGTGKTTFARALAASCQVPFISGSLAEWQAAGHLGRLLRAMRECFDTARKAAPCILLVDEIDSFGDRRSFKGNSDDYAIQVVNGFLEELDGAVAREGVVVIGACNYPDRLDPALTRSGRLDRAIAVSLPDAPALTRIFRHHLGASDLPDVDLAALALRALGGTGADCERWVRGARRRARAAGRAMALDDLLAEIAGPAARRSPEDTRRTAVHEAGHAVARALLLPGTLVCASIRAAGNVGGFAWGNQEGRFHSRDDALAEMQVHLAGRAAEQLLLGTVSSSAGGGEDSDLAQATLLAAEMISATGLDEALGLSWTGQPSARTLHRFLRARPRLTDRISALLAQAHRDVADLLCRHRTALSAVADALVERDTLTGAEIKAILARTRSTLRQ